MEEDKKSFDGILEKVALITDGLQSLFPEGKMICIYELKEEDYKKVQNNFRKIDQQYKRFSIDISGVEHVFINENYQLENNNKNLTDKKTFKQKLFSWFKRG
jgi:hypothetical protein